MSLPVAQLDSSSSSPSDSDRGCEESSLNTGFHCSLSLDKPIYREILFEFVDDLSKRLATMDQLLERGSLGELAEAAHALKGAGGSIGYHAFTDPCRDLEQAARQNDLQSSKHHLEAVRTVSTMIIVPGR